MALQVDQLRHMAATHPDRVAYVEVGSGAELTFAAWASQSHRLARGLVTAGVAPGDRVAIYLEGEHVLRWVVAYAAIHAAGAVAVPTNTRLAVPEVAAVLGHAEPVAAITSRTLRPDLDAAAVPTLRLVVAVDDDSWDDMLADDDALTPHDATFQVPTADDALADIMYTSGTTGLPKGIAVSHAGLHIMANGDPRWTGQAWLHSSPLFTFAGISFVYNPMKMGMTALYLPRFDAATWFDVVEARRPTMAFLVPATAQLLASHERFESADLTSLTIVSIGSAPLPPTLHRRLAERLPDAAVSNNYSMTESGTAFTYLPKEDVERKAGSVGIPMGTEIRIVDEHGGSPEDPLPPGDIGEVLIRVGVDHRRYYRDDVATAQTWDGEWLRSGDLGYLDDEGYLFIVGRAKDVIVRGGNNVHAADIEAVLYEHPAVAEAAVAAVPHEVLGEDVGAWIVLRPGANADAEEIRGFCAARLADYKVPRSVTFLAELPRNPTGKVLKRQLSP